MGNLKAHYCFDVPDFHHVTKLLKGKRNVWILEKRNQL